MVLCGQEHEFREWVIGIAQVLAAAAAAWAAYWAGRVAQRVGDDSLAFQRRLDAPRLSILERTRPTKERMTTEWDVQLRNDGLTAANIERFWVMVDGALISPAPLEDPALYWFRVLQALGLKELGNLSGETRVPPNSFSAGLTESVFHVELYQQDRAAIQTAMRKLSLEIAYTTVVDDETVVLRRSFGGAAS